MRVRDLYAKILDIESPWHVSAVLLDIAAGTVVVTVESLSAEVTHTVLDLIRIRQ